MSTKANFKAIVLILTVALTSLFISPASAFINADSLVLSSATASQEIGETATANSPTVTVAYLGQDVGDTYSVTVSLVSMPSGNTRFPVLRLIETTSAVVFGSDFTNPYALNAVVPTNTPAKISPKVNGLAVIGAKFQVYMDAATKAGTYVVRLTPGLASTGSMAAASQTLTITVGAVTPTPDPSPTPIPTDISQITAPIETSTPETYTVSMNVSRTLVNQLSSKSQTENDVLINMRFNSSDLGDTATIQSYLVSAPSGSSTVPLLEFVQVINGNVDVVAPVLGSVTPGVSKSNNPFLISGQSTPAVVQAQFKLRLDAPKKPGVYVVKIMLATKNGRGSAPPNGVNVIILVTKDPQTYPVSSEVVISRPGEITNKSDAEIFASSTVDILNEVAVIRTTLRSSTGALALLDSYTAVISGPGLLGTAPLTTDINSTGFARALVAKVGDAVTVYADGNPGTAMITISSFDGNVVGVKTVNFVDLSNQSTALLSLSFSSFPEKGSLVTVTALVNLPGSVRFTNNGKTLGSCARVTATGSPKTAVCGWKPPVSGQVKITATFVPSDIAIAPITQVKTIAIGRRSGPR